MAGVPPLCLFVFATTRAGADSAESCQRESLGLHRDIALNFALNLVLRKFMREVVIGAYSR